MGFCPFSLLTQSPTTLVGASQKEIKTSSSFSCSTFGCFKEVVVFFKVWFLLQIFMAKARQKKSLVENDKEK